jgi:hypothetical protein
MRMLPEQCSVCQSMMPSDLLISVEHQMVSEFRDVSSSESEL